MHTFKTQGIPLVNLLLKNHNDHSQRSMFHKTNYHQIGWQDLQPGANYTNSSQTSEEKLCVIP